MYDLWRLPVDTAAALAVGLREDSRIKMKVAGLECTPDMVLSASMVDYLALLWWGQTVDGQKGINRPKSVLSKLTGTDQKTNGRLATFSSGEEFSKRYKQLIGG